MNKKLTVLVVPLNGSGHINATVGLSRELRKLGHRIVFALDKAWKGKVVDFEEKIYDEQLSQNENSNGNSNQFWGEFIKEMCQNFRKPVEDQIDFSVSAMKTFIRLIKNCDDQIKDIIKEIQPDVIIQDHYVCYPSLATSGVPVIQFHSANPLTAIDDPRTPPASTGYPVNDQTKWESYRKKGAEAVYQIWSDYNDWVISKGAPALELFHFLYESKYLNIYLYPEALDYVDVRPLSENWQRVECLDYAQSLNEASKFELPEVLKNNSGKLIFLSLGSFGSADIELMKRIVNLLKNSPHRFIVSKGPRGAEYELPKNMWGSDYLPQLQILQIVDLVITHGGNNSFTECLYFGKPMIILPLFGDQHDNAQRVEELNLGASFNPFKVTEEQLLNEIDKLTSNYELLRKIQDISNQLQSSKSLEATAKRIQEIITKI